MTRTMVGTLLALFALTQAVPNGPPPEPVKAVEAAPAEPTPTRTPAPTVRALAAGPPAAAFDRPALTGVIGDPIEFRAADVPGGTFDWQCSGEVRVRKIDGGRGVLLFTRTPGKYTVFLAPNPENSADQSCVEKNVEELQRKDALTAAIRNKPPKAPEPLIIKEKLVLKKYVPGERVEPQEGFLEKAKRLCEAELRKGETGEVSIEWERVERQPAMAVAR